VYDDLNSVNVWLTVKNVRDYSLFSFISYSLFSLYSRLGKFGGPTALQSKPQKMVQLEIILNFYLQLLLFVINKKEPLRMRSVPPRFHNRKAWNVPRWPRWPWPWLQVKVSPPRAQDRTLRLIIVVCGPESVLPDVLAIHTIEMIPKSMILSGTS